MIKCECSERIGSVINSYQLYEEIKMFLKNKLKKAGFQKYRQKNRIVMGLSGKLTNGTSVFAVDVFGNLNILISQQKVLSVSLLMEYITRRRQGNMNINEPISNPKLVSAIEGLSNNNATQQKFLKNQHKLNYCVLQIFNYRIVPEMVKKQLWEKGLQYL